jgi:hypothetical protein
MAHWMRQNATQHDIPSFRSQYLTSLDAVSGVLAIASLYFGKDVLIPLALSLLLSFLLAPLITLLDRWKFGSHPQTGRHSRHRYYLRDFSVAEA